MRGPTPAEATEFIRESGFVWHQRFDLAPGIPTPGVNPIDYLFEHSSIPGDLTGLSVLDIGTTNGAAAFECERRGAARVVAVDIMDVDWFGFRALRSLFDSRAEFVQANLYELADVLDEQFDVVVFWGVLYHLRHPLLGLDGVRRLARGIVSLETAIANDTDPADQPVARFHRLDDLGGDGTNWWRPTGRALEDWVRSAGFDVTRTKYSDLDERCSGRVLMELKVDEGQPEYLRVSYERPVKVSVQPK